MPCPLLTMVQYVGVFGLRVAVFTQTRAPAVRVRPSIRSWISNGISSRMRGDGRHLRSRLSSRRGELLKNLILSVEGRPRAGKRREIESAAGTARPRVGAERAAPSWEVPRFSCRQQYRRSPPQFVARGWWFARPAVFHAIDNTAGLGTSPSPALRLKSNLGSNGSLCRPWRWDRHVPRSISHWTTAVFHASRAPCRNILYICPRPPMQYYDSVPRLSMTFLALKSRPPPLFGLSSHRG